jgi:DNA invertase Pin-like site-specific DNA recombinase
MTDQNASKRQLRALGWAAVSSRQQTDEDKFSLPEQERTIRAFVESQEWHLVDVLTVPGHSRRFIDFHELKDAALTDGIDAFQRLDRYWNDRAFDVLIVRDGDRFARTQALHAYVVERTINMGAKIYSLNDGWVDDGNYRMWIAMGGYKAAGDIDRLVKHLKIARRERVNRGLTANGTVCMSHYIIRNEQFKAQGIGLREDMRPLFADVAVLLLEGTAFTKIERELASRFGHINPRTNKPYSSGYMRKVLYSPVFWGHTATIPDRLTAGGWVYDETQTPPDVVTIAYNQHEPMYTGVLAQDIKAELNRRAALVGHASPQNTAALSGLMVCGECGYSIVNRKSDWGAYYRCNTPRRTGGGCGQRKHVREDRVFAWLDRIFTVMLERGVFEFEPRQDAAAKEYQAYSAEIEQLETDLRQLIQNQTRAPESAKVYYTSEINRVAQRLEVARNTLRKLENTLKSRVSQDRESTLLELKTKSLAWFWEQDGRYINQTLRKILGDKRIVIKDGDVIGIAAV